MRLILNLLWVLLGTLSAVFAIAYAIGPEPSPLPFAGQQVWKHRANTSQLAIDASKAGYRGVELDLSFLNGELHLAHDPSEYDGAVALADYMSQIESSNERPLFWLDIKNLTLFNESAITRQLLALSMSDRLIVESPRPFFMYRLCSSGLLCSVWVKRFRSGWERAWYRVGIALLSRYGRVGAFSIDREAFGLADRIGPDDFPKLVYTFPPGSDFDEWKSRPSARILLTD